MLNGNFFPKTPALSRTTTYGPLTPSYASEKANEPILRKLADRQKDRQKNRQKDGQTLFYRTLPAEAGGLKITKPKNMMFLKLRKENLTMISILKDVVHCNMKD